VTARITGPALLLDAADAARIDRQLRDAIRLAWLTRGLAPPHALVEHADQVHELAKQFRANTQAGGPRETVSTPDGENLPALLDNENLTVEQAAPVMGVTPQHARALARRGAITASRAAGGRSAWVIDTASALAWAADRREARHRKEAA
jgi:hypothetical protein